MGGDAPRTAASPDDESEPRPDTVGQPNRAEARQASARALGRATLVLMAANLVGSILGFVRLGVIASVFGAQQLTGSFAAASYIPQMFYDLTIGAAVSAAMIPTFTEIAEKRGRDELARTAGSVLVLAWLALGAVTILIEIFARPLMVLILVHNHQHLQSSGVDLAVVLVRILLPSILFLGTSDVLLSTLYSVRRFTVPAFASGLYHVGIIAGAIWLAHPLGIKALAVGAVAGAAAQASIQIPSLVRAGVRPRLALHLSPDVRRIIRLYAPVAAGLIISVIGQAIDLAFKWQLGRSAVAAMYFATALTQFPIGIAVAGLSFAILPSLSADVAFNRLAEFKSTLATGIKLVLFMTVPAAVGFVLLATPIIGLVIQRGHFGPGSTALTASALIGYAFQIPFVGIDQLLIFAFYARKNTLTPMLIGVVGVVIYVISALILRPRLHVLGLALANSIQNSAHGVILMVLLLVAVGSLAGNSIVRGLIKTVVAAGVMGAGALFLSDQLIPRLSPSTQLARLVDGGVPILAGVVLYFGMSVLLRSSELSLLVELFRQRFTKAPAAI